MSVERVERKGGVVWRVRWRDEQGQARSRVVGRKRDAETFEAEVVRRKRTGDLDLLRGGRETLADFAAEWWKLYAVPNLATRTLSQLRRPVGQARAPAPRLDAAGSDHAGGDRALPGRTGI